MRAINHALTGAVVGLTITNPAVAVPLAFLSHFVCDLIPHWDEDHRIPMGTKLYSLILVTDAVLCILLVALLFAASPTDWFIASLCAFAATTPDLMWIGRYLRSRKLGKDPGPSGWLQNFHSRIQWQTGSKWFWLELAWAAGMSYLITKLV